MSELGFTICREIGIDAGHRVTFHGSKCRSLHGHRYTVSATCAGPLAKAGEQQGMVLDFGFLKEEMLAEIDAPCDHGLILWIDDPLAAAFMEHDVAACREVVLRDGSLLVPGALTGKLYLVPFVPTAEELARHWYGRLAPRVLARSTGLASLKSIKVWETPNCVAEYAP
jgi:6-pyruvoyltetrahydropterin/6-carboxytetrahydropterin synthase